MKLLKVKSDDGLVHNIQANLVVDYVEVDENTTTLKLGYPLEKETFTVPWNADELIEEIYGIDDTDDIYEIIDCTPLQPPPEISIPASVDAALYRPEAFAPPESEPTIKRRRGRKK